MYYKNVMFSVRYYRLHESLIRTYEGEDPLQPYWDYVSWLEQSYPHQGPENNLEPLLEIIITKFREYEKYKQDPRFVRILIKYVSMFPVIKSNSVSSKQYIIKIHCAIRMLKELNASILLIINKFLFPYMSVNKFAIIIINLLITFQSNPPVFNIGY